MAKNISCYLIRIPCVLTCVHCFLSFCCTWLRRVWCYPLYNLPSGSFGEQKCLSFPFSIPRLTVPTSRAYSCTSCPQLLTISVASSGLTPVCQCPFCTEETRNRHNTLNAVLQVPKNSTGPAVTQVPKQIWMQLALFAARSHCWFMFDLLLTRTLRFFSAELFLWQSALACIVPRDYSIKKQDWVFSCWTSQGSCRSFLQVPLKSSLSLQWIVHSIRLVLFTNLMTEGTILAHWSWIKAWNSLCASFDPWGMLLATSHQQFLPTAWSTYPVHFSPVWWSGLWETVPKSV